jgi:mannose-6-phosphate isomerase
LADVIRDLTSKKSDSRIKSLFLTLLSLKPADIETILVEAVANAKLQGDADPVCHWIIRLHDQYPQDIGVLAPAILNLVCLSPGEALYLPNGELHAYLEGTAIEVMANSDNVVRGGLTSKHADVLELQRVVNFRECALEVIKPVARSAVESVYVTPAKEFELSRIRINGAVSYESPSVRNVEILICIEGDSVIRNADGRPDIGFTKGQAAIVPAAVTAYGISGKAEFYKATVPL